MKETCISIYGVDNYSKTNEFKDRIKKNFFENKKSDVKIYGELLQSNGGKYKIKCIICNNQFEILQSLLYNRMHNGHIICTICNPKKQPIKQMEIYSFTEDNFIGEKIKNSRIDNKEIDIYIPELKLGFEFNGLYWHSEIYKEKNYHLDKTKLCNDNGIQLFHIWEDDWEYKQDIVKSMIINKLGKTPNKIFARKCEVKEVNDNKLVRNFLIKNHIQGFIGSKIKLGLFHQGELVSLMTFGNLRKSLGQKSQEGSYELLRFCNKLNTNIVGGASKLFKYFLNNYDVKEVISYSDLSRSNGNLYKELGFEFKGNSDPNYYYVIDGIRKHRFGFRKDKLVKDGFDSNKTEIQIMNERGYYRIFDCGMQKWTFVK